jgi:hypothetical protein
MECKKATSNYRYLLVELRGPALQKEGTFDWDACLPESGFLIWEVNEKVGRKDPLTQTSNVYWPCVYTTLPGHRSEGQNDSDDLPLVGLWRPNVTSVRNLDLNAILSPEHLWNQDNQILQHPLGITLSHFRTKDRKGEFHYRVEVSASRSPRTLNTPLANGFRDVHVPPPATGPKEVTGTPDSISADLPTGVNHQLTNVFTAYPKFNHSIVSQDNQLTAITLPASVQSKQSFAQDVASQIHLLNGAALGDRQAEVMPPEKISRHNSSDTAFTDLFDKVKVVSTNVGAKIGTSNIRVAGAHVDIQRDSDQRDRVHYFFSEQVSLPSLPRSLSGVVRKEAVMAFLKWRFPGRISKNSKLELIVENGTGDLKWQCQVPTVPTSGPVTIEIDARNDAKSLGPQTPIVIK